MYIYKNKNPEETEGINLLADKLEQHGHWQGPCVPCVL